MSAPPGSVAVARRSLKHFALGRVISAVVGVTTLLVLVRALDRADYGFYIALMAGFEIAQLAASPGAYAVVFRYVPELRQAANSGQLIRLSTWLAAYRGVTLLLVAAALVVSADNVAGFLGMPGQALAVRLFALVFAFEGMSRLIDVQFESLLEQGFAQFSVLLRNGAKLAILLTMTAGVSQTVSLQAWIAAEAATMGLGCATSMLLMVRYLRTMPVAAASSVDLSLARVRRFALPTYISQVVYMSSSTEMVKILVSKLVGAAVTASFGFASALAATMQRYLPSFLLVGWLRPLFITAREQGKSGAEIVRIAGTVIKLNALLLAPLSCGLLVAGPEVIHVLAGGRLPDSLPYLLFFVALLLLQSIRAVVSLLGFTFELGSASLMATMFSVLGLLTGLLLFHRFGVWGLCAGIAVSEVLWILSMATSLKRAAVPFSLPWFGLSKLCASVVATAIMALAALRVFELDNHFVMLLAGVVSAILCLLLAAFLKPFESSERLLINRLLPARMFVW